MNYFVSKQATLYYGPKYSIFYANCTVVFVFGGRNNKYAFQYTFKNDTSQYEKRKKKKPERTKSGPSRRYSRWVTHPVPTGLNLSAATKPSFTGVIAKYVFLLIIIIIIN